jgi:hypothetical protein
VAGTAAVAFIRGQAQVIDEDGERGQGEVFGEDDVVFWTPPGWGIEQPLNILGPLTRLYSIKLWRDARAAAWV